VRILDSEVAARDSQAGVANLLRGGTAAPTFDVFTLDYVEPYASDAKFEDAVARAAQHGIAPAFWQMTVVNPAVDLSAAAAGAGFEVSWETYGTSPDPETMADVGWYEVRRSAGPIDSEAAWAAAAVVAADLPAGTRSVVDGSPPGSGPLFYAVRAFRSGTGRVLLGTVTVQAR
jgi:hypothetical protein